MSDNWVIIDFQDLMKSILNGNRLIQEPISISNKRRDTVSKISFLNMLLSYNNVNKDNLLDVLSNIYYRFHNRIDQLKENDIVQHMMDCINQEWYDPEYMFVFDFPFSRDFFEKNKDNKVKYDSSCKICNQIKHLSTIENNIPLKIEKHGEHPLDKHFHKGIDLCKTTIEFMKENLIEIESIIKSMKKIDMTQFIDLSIKHKALYLKLSGKDEDDDSIPENIHHIFSNYYHIHNLLLKQLIQYFHYVSHLLEQLEERCLIMQNLQQNVKSIAYFEENSDSSDDGEDDELLIEDGEVYHTTQTNKEGGDNSIIDKLSSFF
tara:strand:+ start:459 stop:1415 length:957 start_codon:yes stop_codon:yes gene_type:complete